MYKGKTIGVVIPAYNEEKFIRTVVETVPAYVDRVFVVDDSSSDRTNEIAVSTARADSGRVEVILHEQNFGVGRAIVTGYKQCFKNNLDIVAIMAGDNQMDPVQLPRLLDLVVEGKADYAIGDRISKLEHMKSMSYWRRFGNWLLRWLTRVAALNFSICDPQNGFTVITREALSQLDLDRIYARYGYCNDMLVKLSANRAKIKYLPMPAVYGSEKSKIKYRSYIPNLSKLLIKDFLWRLRFEFTRRQNNL